MALKNYLILLLSFIVKTSFHKEDIEVKKGKTGYVDGRFLYAPNGEKIILRGINRMNLVTNPTGEKLFPEIAKTRADCVCIMWMKRGGGVKQLDTIIGNCIKNKLLPIIELHDATGKWNKLEGCVDFWVQKDVVAVLKKFQKNTFCST